MPHWLHLVEVVVAAILVLFLVVLLSAFGWAVVLGAALFVVAAWFFIRWLAHRHAHPNRQGV